VKDIIDALIKISDVQSDIDKSLRIITLKIIRKVVELEVQNENTPAFEWEGS